MLIDMHLRTLFVGVSGLRSCISRYECYLGIKMCCRMPTGHCRPECLKTPQRHVCNQSLHSNACLCRHVFFIMHLLCIDRLLIVRGLTEVPFEIVEVTFLCQVLWLSAQCEGIAPQCMFIIDDHCTCTAFFCAML